MAESLCLRPTPQVFERTKVMTLTSRQPYKMYSCNKCQWVHFGICRADGGEQCQHCFRCGNPHTDFSPSDGSGCPTGSTIQAILHEEESEPAAKVAKPKNIGNGTDKGKDRR